MTEKSAVRLLLKKGVSKGSEIGFDAEVIATEGVSVETLKDLADKASEVAQYLIKKPLINNN